MSEVTINGRQYRGVPGVVSEFGGRWEFFWSGKWRPVLNYAIKRELNRAAS